ncbi:5-formyltetrahydrofolate cyclo-ligase [Phenylobacterium aquaticum]|uniref:5-formyltetrahydrofolate cyclo-ligase n=2 Tax=Phenylobacterium aquaticum TaxID=1763816 RepID=UPI0026EB374D|nr:5-formyltetrahydrofolate cyclo-ligase [Phenylobacterium aquaticum]
MTDPASAKLDLRRAFRVRRAALAKAAPDAAQRAADLAPIHALPAFACFAGYHALGSELNPGPLIRRLSALGGLFALPVCEGPDAPLIFRLWDDRDRPVPDAMGVPAPPPHAPRVHPDLVIVPLLGFDRRGGRLGQGGGHYDRTLAALRAVRPVFVLGLAYAGQEAPELDLEPHDQRLDAILTENGYIPVERP